MSKIILITGGSRSGKSALAQQRAEEDSDSRIFIATCPKIDGEMDERIAKHRRERHGKGWTTIEEEVEISSIIKKNLHIKTVLVDCLTLWINNLIYRHKTQESRVNEEDIITLCHELLTVSRHHPGTIFFVTNEVGSGIVPESCVTRHFRDLVGKCNQVMAKGADEVILVSCGIPLFLKTSI